MGDVNRLKQHPSTLSQLVHLRRGKGGAVREWEATGRAYVTPSCFCTEVYFPYRLRSPAASLHKTLRE